jgi:excinuclease ABC subunit C
VEIEDKVRVLPQTPGVYKYLDKNGKVIYVGKAKNLKKRVSSYFAKNHQSFRTSLLVKNIFDIEYVVVENESDALLLENLLIKELQPKYNVLLKDDKTYPWLCIKNEKFPRVFYTRQKINDGSEYYGPFTSVHMIKTLLQLVKSLYPIRTCNLLLNEENISKGKYNVCLEYHIGNCTAPCVGKIDEASYDEFITNIRKTVRGDLHIIQQYLKNEMNRYASGYKYEEAAKIKEKLDIIDNYRSKSTIVNTSISNVEVYGFAKDINSAYINYLRVQNGAIISAHSVELKKKIEESDEDMLLYAIVELRSLFNSNVKNLILPFKIDYEIEDLHYIYPQRGDKMKLLELAQRNAKFFMLERHKQIENKNPEKHAIRKLETLKKDLHLDELPVHIECFDNSNIQGTNPVAACVVFKNAKPSKSDYRHYNIKTVEGPDDFASMSEVIYRRYKRLLDEKAALPQLIIIDGGKGQLNAAMESLKKLGLYGKLGIIGIAKRLEEIYFPNDSIPLYLDKNSESLKIIQQARDEAHRFGISFHRDKRSGSFIKSELQEIKGVGEKTMAKLLSTTKSVVRIKEMSLEELSEIIGEAKGRLVFDYFNKDKKNKK